MKLTMSSQPATPFPILKTANRGDDAHEIVQRDASNEFVFAVVGHAGSGTSLIAKELEALIADESINDTKFHVSVLKARDVIETWANNNGKSLPAIEGKRSIEDVELLQDYGDEIRLQPRRNGKADFSAVARGMVQLIRDKRAAHTESAANGEFGAAPDRKPRAYVLDSIRHPAEVELLRYTYGEAFVLIGVVCEENKRIRRIQKKYDCSESEARSFMERDADDKKKHGQHVADAFHLSDFFVDNTVDRTKANHEPNREWKVSEDLSRLIKLITCTSLIRPTLAETAMYQAFSSQMQSACLSRQVGAAVIDRGGTIVATGTNEAPQAGGGVYGETLGTEREDGRCAFRLDPRTGMHICRNTHRQNEIIEELLEKIPELKATSAERKEFLREEVRRTRVGSLLEFSRAVHAEMDALISAARKGVSPIGCRLFVTTFPCHYCARHIVSAGIDEVQFIEPYPKSLAIDLHDDSIAVEASGWVPPSNGGTQVLFRPFSGVSPRLYKRAFLKDRELKNKVTGVMEISQPEWASPWHLPVSSYIEREFNITKEDASE
ncbi:MAG TPA: anti-phage dCTP deaminase [Bryobacteraceae bacterium]